MNRKSDLNEEELRELKNQFESERSKSMSIEQSIVRLQRDNSDKADRLAQLKQELSDVRED